MRAAPRVAFFPDSLTEVNGVARTSRQLVACAMERALPFLCVHGGSATRTVHDSPTLTRVELRRGRMSFGLEHDLRFDLRLWRYTRAVRTQVDAFGADLIHITGPSDVGQLGAYLAHTMGIPLVASWHTNLHDFAESRLERLLRPAPRRFRSRVAAAAGRQSLKLVLDFYKMARVVLAPNDEVATLLRTVTKRPVFPMMRGVDTALFSPEHRTRTDQVFRIGYVGRLSPEKNVRTLVTLEQALIDLGAAPFRFTIVGEGSERPWLETHMRHADFPGVLDGAPLAAAYANLDVFVFPSTTDTYGNVVQESFASGTPVVVTRSGGPKFLVREGVTGFVRDGVPGFADAVLTLRRDPALTSAMRVAARARAMEASWPRVFEQVQEAYAECMTGHRNAVTVSSHNRRELSWLARIVTASLARKAL